MAENVEPQLFSLCDLQAKDLLFAVTAGPRKQRQGPVCFWKLILEFWNIADNEPLAAPLT